LSRSARICFSIESWMEVGGSMSLELDAVDRMPHCRGSSRIAQGGVDLLAGGEGPLQVHAADDVRRVVTVALDAGCSWPPRTSRRGVGHLVVMTVSMLTTRLSWVMTGCGGKGRLLGAGRSVADRVDNGTTMFRPALRCGCSGRTFDDGCGWLRDHLDRLDQCDEDQNHQNDQDE